MKDGKLEELDYKILMSLTRDGRKGYKNLGDELEKSHLTIKKHMDELESVGVIKDFTITINYEKLGYTIVALIEITIDKGKMIDVEKDLSKDPHIYGVYDLTGQYDAIILARFKNREELNILVKEINSKEYIIRTNTHLILNVIKEGSTFEDLIKKDKLIE